VLPDQHIAIPITGQMETAIPDDEEIDEPFEALEARRIDVRAHQARTFDQIGQAHQTGR
jgi:hypothetical protein